MTTDGCNAALRALIIAKHRDASIRLIESYLTQAGYLIEHEEDGRSGLARARHAAPPLLVSEILVPQLDGLSICRALKADPAMRRTRVVLLSVLAAEDRAREAGADAFWRKPPAEALLVESLARLVGRPTN
jgi:CheY-like chemotaxis protein